MMDGTGRSMRPSPRTPDVGHFVAEEAPDEMLGALTAFLVSGTEHEPRPESAHAPAP